MTYWYPEGHANTPPGRVLGGVKTSAIWALAYKSLKIDPHDDKIACRLHVSYHIICLWRSSPKVPVYLDMKRIRSVDMFVKSLQFSM
ncbi:hypothetical protein AcV7_006915 [Taiwanofungus camphoratus]|nr:hypothetical protein AcV7_006915 [Antrodia cinnamomea]